MPVSLKAAAKKYLGKAINLVSSQFNLQEKNSPQVKINQRMLFNFYRYSIGQGYRCPLSDTGFRVYSQFEEDGILLYIFAAIGIEHKTFIDIGSGDGINSNCANFAVNFGWNGLFIDGNPANIERGKKYYASNPDTWAYPPTFVNAFIQRENINELIRDNGFAGGA
ncbi:MAG: hypothetical protein Q8O04_04965 [Deltaproteobacteria bacterium]|nr:hypothetical protein [Deltaproteobacteria bacterium]